MHQAHGPSLRVREQLHRTEQSEVFHSIHGKQRSVRLLT